jgi:hypothetical protein
MLGALVIVQAWIAVTLARAAHVPAWGSLAIVALTTTTTTAALVRWVPLPVLGAEGLWFRRSLERFVGRFGRERSTLVAPGAGR